MMALHLFLYFLLSFTYPEDEISFKIEIHNIRSANGKIVLAVFDGQENFKNERALLEKSFAKDEMQGNVLTILLSLEKGTYGIAVFDDENGDGKMNYNLIGLPKEGFGFSNYYHKGFRNPKFSKFQFSHKDSLGTIIIDLRYMR